MGNFVTPDLLMDLPENWTDNQFVSPNGTEVGLSERYGYNYLMSQVNKAQKAVTELDSAMASDTENMLDNWCFLDPVNRLNGYMVMNGVKYYSNNSLTTLVGTTSVPVAAQYVNSAYSIITINGTQYYVASTDVYSGYAVPSVGQYTFDRWWGNYCAVTKTKVASTGLTLTALASDVPGELYQCIPNPAKFAGKRITLSVLVTSITGTSSGNRIVLYKASAPTGGTKVQISAKELASGLNSFNVSVPNDVGGTTYPYLRFSIEAGAGRAVTFTAVRCQLGTRSTLAYGSGTGPWTLRDIPNKVIETVKCNGAPTDIGGQGMIVVPEDIGLSTANTMAVAEVITEEETT